MIHAARFVFLLSLALLGPLASSGCSSAPAAAAPVALAASFDACAMLTSADVKELQGEELVESKSTAQAEGAVVIHQCFYRLADFSRSISISAGTVGRAYWDRMFAERKGDDEEEREREGKREALRRQRGIGDEAYWVPTPVGGTLYVRRGDHMLRIALGGKATDAERLAKATALARRALTKLP